MSPRLMGKITATYCTLTSRNAPTRPDDPFVQQAQHVLIRLGRVSGIISGTTPARMKPETNYARAVAERLDTEFWNRQATEGIGDNMFGFGPLLHNATATKIRLPRLREATLVLQDEDSVSLHEVRKELSAFRRIVSTLLIAGSGRNSIPDVIQAALLAAAALFSFQVPQNEHARLKPEYAELMTKITQHSSSTSDTYVCLIFGYAYLGGWAGVHSLFEQTSSSSPAAQLMPACAVADTQATQNLHQVAPDAILTLKQSTCRKQTARLRQKSRSQKQHNL